MSCSFFAEKKEPKKSRTNKPRPLPFIAILPVPIHRDALRPVLYIISNTEGLIVKQDRNKSEDYINKTNGLRVGLNIRPF